MVYRGYAGLLPFLPALFPPVVVLHWDHARAAAAAAAGGGGGGPAGGGGVAVAAWSPPAPPPPAPPAGSGLEGQKTLLSVGPRLCLTAAWPLLDPCLTTDHCLATSLSVFDH